MYLGWNVQRGVPLRTVTAHDSEAFPVVLWVFPWCLTEAPTDRRGCTCTTLKLHVYFEVSTGWYRVHTQAGLFFKQIYAYKKKERKKKMSIPIYIIFFVKGQATNIINIFVDQANPAVEVILSEAHWLWRTFWEKMRIHRLNRYHTWSIYSD